MSIRKSILPIIVIIFIFSCIFTGCDKNTTSSTTTSTTTTTTAPETSWYQDLYASFKAIMPTDIPANLTTDGLKNGSEFDVNSYFSVLTHLSMEPGYVLDYVYLFAGSAGGPILYIRRADRAPFQTYEEYRLASHDTPRPDNDQSMIWLVKDEPDQKTGNRINIDGTDEGDFEYALLQTIGNQFYLYGPAEANDRRLVATSTEREKNFTEIKDAGLNPMDKEFLKSARAIDLNPVVKTQANYMLIQFVTFSRWGGFYRVSYLIALDYPHIAFSYNNEVLLAYAGVGEY